MKTRIALFAIAVCFSPIVSQARWLNPDTGRFQTMDTYEGNQEEPKSLHKYTYAENDPVNNVDPDGHESIASVMLSFNISGMFAQITTPMAAQVQQRARQVTGRPGSEKFWPAYLNYEAYKEQQDVWKHIGGGTAKRYGTPSREWPEGQNSCAARVSYGLNYGGQPIPRGTPGADRNWSDQVYAGKKGDDKNYIINVGKLNEYLRQKWGPPDHTPTTVGQLNSVKNSLMGQQTAIFATKQSPGHSGALKTGYNDPYVEHFLPLDIWKLSP